MAAAKHNIITSRGEDYTVTLSVKNLSDEPVSITGAEFKGEIRRGTGKPLVASFAFANGGEGNQVIIELPDTETNKLDPHITYQYDIFRTVNSDAAQRLLYGSIVAEGGVTTNPKSNA